MTSQFSLPLGQSGPSWTPPGTQSSGSERSLGGHTCFHQLSGAAARWALQRVCGFFWHPGGASWVELTTKLSVNGEQMECRLLLTFYCQYLFEFDYFHSLKKKWEISLLCLKRLNEPEAAVLSWWSFSSVWVQLRFSSTWAPTERDWERAAGTDEATLSGCGEAKLWQNKWCIKWDC